MVDWNRKIWVIQVDNPGTEEEVNTIHYILLPLMYMGEKKRTIL